MARVDPGGGAVVEVVPGIPSPREDAAVEGRCVPAHACRRLGEGDRPRTGQRWLTGTGGDFRAPRAGQRTHARVTADGRKTLAPVRALGRRTGGPLALARHGARVRSALAVTGHPTAVVGHA